MVEIAGLARVTVMVRDAEGAYAPPSQSEQPTSVLTNIWEQLQRALTSRDHLRAVLPSTIPDGQGDQRHQADLPRLRDGRGSIILKTGPGSFVERESAPLDPPGVFGTSVSLLAPLPQPSATMNWWLVTPNAMAFENIAFTRPVALQGNVVGSSYSSVLC